MQDSVYSPRPAPKRLPADAPDILIVLIDNAGPGLPSTFGGEVTTPTMDRIVAGGIAYNRFHTTAMCLPTRASLLTGRNHHRVGNGQIAEFANDWDGYSGLKVAQMRELFLIEATRNKALPIGGGLWVALHPEFRVAPPYTAWTFSGDTVRMPEFCAPALGNKPNVVRIDAEVPANANGVLYKLGAHSGGLTLFVEDGVLCYEYNLFIIQRTQIRASRKLPVGRVTIEVETTYAIARPAGPLSIKLKVNGEVVGEGQVPISAPVAFTANDCLDIGMALGSPVSLDYCEKAPFRFNGSIACVHVEYATAH
jgi:hypothetical protein